MIFIKLFKRIVLRTIREDRFLTALSILGVALGIGLFMGVNTATNRAISSFEANISGLDQAFNYEVLNSSGIDFRENVYRPVREVADKSLPVLTTNAFLPGLDETVTVNGVYTVRAFSFLNPASQGGIDIEAVFTRLNGMLVTKRLSDRYGVKKGDTLPALVYNKKYSLVIVGVLDMPAVPDNTVFMDLGNFQEYFGKVGLLSRIDIIAGEKEARAIAKLLPAGLSIEQKAKLLRNRESLIDAFRFNLRFVTFLAVLVGVFLLYNTIFISVIKRRTEIGILRGLGMDRRTLIALFSGQGVLLGFLGSILGIGFGQASAWFSISMVGATVSRFYGHPGVSDHVLTFGDVVWTVALGLLVSFLASLAPAVESANVRPMESSRAGAFEKAYKRRQALFSIIGGILIFSGAIITWLDYRYVPFSFPWLSHAGILLFILGCTLNAPAYLGLTLRLLKKPLYRFFKAVARIAFGDINGTRYRFSLALMSVAVSSALIVAIVSSVYSLKSSFIDWINTYVSADVYIKPASCTANFCYYPLPPDIENRVSQLPGVKTIGRFRSLQIDFHGKSIVAGFGDSQLLWKNRPGVGREEKERLKRLSLYPEVIISDYVAVQYGLKKGETVEIQTPRGVVPFRINNSSISYSTMTGFMYFDRRWLKEYWGLDDATQLSVYLLKGQDVRQFINTLDKTVGRTYALDITDNAELRRAVLRIFDRSFAITYTIELIAIVISLIGVVNALLILVLEKKREISILRYLGATWQHIRKQMLLSAGIVGIAGIVLGSVMGTGISIVITHVINRISFGWEVGFKVPVSTVSLLMALLFVTTMLAGIVPSYLTRKIDPKAYISFE